MSKIIDAIFPMYANRRNNKKLQQQLITKPKSLLSYIENSNSINTEVLKQQYDETFYIKDKLEDKAKANIIGITIAITLIIGASDILNTISNKFQSSIIQWLAFVLISVAVIYLIIAGIIVTKVLLDENIVYTVKLNSFALDKATIRSDYDRCIVQNRIQNLIRNNSIFSSYECIRNALICLFIILLLSTIPIKFYHKDNVEINLYEQYSFTYSSETVTFLKNNDVKSVVEDKILNIIKNNSISKNTNNEIGVIDNSNNLFIKFKLSEKNITIIMIEPYIVP